MIGDWFAFEKVKVTGVAVVVTRYSPSAAFVAAIRQVPELVALKVTVAVSSESEQLEALPPAAIA